MKNIITAFVLLNVLLAKSQVFVNASIDTADSEIKNAISFFAGYMSEFKGNNSPDYAKYWSAEDCARFNVPDLIVNAISPGYATYKYGSKNIFYARVTPDYVQLKTLIAQTDTSEKVSVYAITNHYISLPTKTSPMRFISPLKINASLYTSVTIQNITYHFPKSHIFNRQKSDSLAQSLKMFEKKWNFAPIKFDYYFADTREELLAMRGFDYMWGMDIPYPSGVADFEDKLIFCNGMGENYLHEALHLYLNPVYEKSFLNHGLVYYLGGGMGHRFDWEIHRMNEYLAKYPETDLSQFQTMETKDKMMHLDHTVCGLLCKIIDEKEGVNGIKRLLQYPTAEELFEKEFHLQPNDWDKFLREKFRKYDK